MPTNLENPKEEKKSEKVRVLGTVITEPENKVSKAGREYTKLVIATSNGIGKENDVVWSVTVMGKLREKLPDALFKKFAYAKFSGLGSHRSYTDKNGVSRVGHDLLVDSVTLPDGEIVYQNEKKTDSEDAPF